MFASVRPFLFSAALCLVGSAAAEMADPNPPVQPAPKELTPAQTEIITKHIKKLSAADNIEREDAERELTRIGEMALPLLKEAAKSTDPETAARARRLVSRMSEMVARPAASYAETMPESSLLFFETPNAAKALENFRASPMGRLWDLPAMKKFYQGHREAQVDSDKKLLDTIGEIRKLADGKALFAMGAPETAEAAELDPPFVYLVESKKTHELESQVRALFECLQDSPKSNRRYGPFTIEEHITAQTVFGVESVAHSLTQMGIEAFLDSRLRKPEKPLLPKLAEVRALLPNYDFILHMANNRFDLLSDAGQLVDDDLITLLNTAGLSEGTSWTGVMAVGADGFEEHVRIVIPDPNKPKEKPPEAKPEAAPADPKDAKPADPAPPPAGAEEKKAPKTDPLFWVLKNMASNMPAAPAADAPQALHLIPWQAGILISFKGDIARNATALATALRELDALKAPPRPLPKPVDPAAKPVDPANPDKPVDPANPDKAANPGEAAPKEGEKPAEKAPGNTPGQQALAEGGGRNIGGNEKPLERQPIGDPRKEPPPKQVYPTIARFEKIGLKLEQFLEQVQGPIQLAIFPHKIEDGDMPVNTPMSPLLAVALKDPAQIEQALEAGAAGPTPRFRKEALNGGGHYIELAGDAETKPGFWLKGNYLVYSSERDLIDLAGLALAHANGNERMADRASYKQALANKHLGNDAILSVFADADQMLEMPYELARLNWQEDDENPWPDYKLVRPLLQNKPVIIDFKGTPTGLAIDALTPLTIWGMWISYRWPLAEGGYIQ